MAFSLFAISHFFSNGCSLDGNKKSIEWCVVQSRITLASFYCYQCQITMETGCRIVRAFFNPICTFHRALLVQERTKAFLIVPFKFPIVCTLLIAALYCLLSVMFHVQASLYLNYFIWEGLGKKTDTKRLWYFCCDKQLMIKLSRLATSFAPACNGQLHESVFIVPSSRFGFNSTQKGMSRTA